MSKKEMMCPERKHRTSYGSGKSFFICGVIHDLYEKIDEAHICKYKFMEIVFCPKRKEIVKNRK